MSHDRLNAYHIMWVLVFFDLPTTTKKEQKVATKFRNFLLNDGFAMWQFSVYLRHCASKENADVHIKRIKSLIPSAGKVSILCITDKQYGDIITFHGFNRKKSDPVPLQLELF